MGNLGLGDRPFEVSKRKANVLVQETSPFYGWYPLNGQQIKDFSLFFRAHYRSYKDDSSLKLFLKYLFMDSYKKLTQSDIG